MAKVCPYCGASDKDKKFVSNYCEDCYQDRILKLELPAVISLEMCKTCNRTMVEGKMSHDFNTAVRKLLAKEVESNVKTAIKHVKFQQGDSHAIVTLKTSNDFELQKKVEVRERNNQCQQCSRKYSGYFEAIIQVRGNQKRINMFTEGLVTKIIKLGSFASKVEELKEGNDIYVADKKIALEAVGDLKIDFTTSKKLAGRKDGKQLYRTSICVRL